MRTLLSLFYLPFLGLAVLLCNVVQIMSLILLPFSGAAFRNVNCLIAGAWFSSLAFLLEALPGLEFVQTGDALPPSENAFVICNHQSGADIPALVVLARRAARTGDLKWFVKDVIRWVPGIGWGMLFLDCLFVKRNWNADKEMIRNTFGRLRRNSTRFWILSFIEGTRLTLPKLERSRQFCQSEGLPVLSHVMSPRTRGFEATLEGLAELTNAVYDVTLAFEGFATGRVPGFRALFFGPIHRVHIHVDRFAATSLPTTKEARVQWVLDRFSAKDQRLASFYRSNRLD
jgi:1-acyl-sn-glycerol-3-phosphate acyltransferase